MGGQVFNCRRKCKEIEAEVENNSPRYRPGVKRCGNCGGGIFIITVEYRCPCCKERLRSKAKNSKTKNVEYE